MERSFFLKRIFTLGGLFLALGCLPGALTYAQETTGNGAAGSEVAEANTAPEAPAPAPATPDSDLSGTGLSALPPLLGKVEDFPKALDLVEERVAAAQTRLDDLTKTEDTPQAEIDRAQARLDRLRSIELVIQRRITMAERMREAEEALASHLDRRKKYEETGFEQEPPFPISLLDRILDERKLAQRDLEATRLSLDAVAESIKSAATELANTQKARRTARDNAESVSQEPGRTEALHALEMAKLDEFSASQRMEALRAQEVVAKKQRELLESRDEILGRVIAEVEPQVTFTQETLDERRAEIATRREKLESQLKEMRRTRDANESRLYEAREAQQKAQKQAADSGQESQNNGLYQLMQAREAWLEASSLGVEYAQQRLANQTTEQQLWDYRYALAHPDESETDPSAWLTEARQVVSRVESEKQQVDARLTSLRGTQLDLQNQLSGASEVIGDKESLESRLRALAQLEERARDYQASLVNLSDLASRLVEQLEVRAVPRTFGDVWLLGWTYAQEFWSYELYVFDDRAFTVGRVCVAAIVFFAVILAAWFVRRILRRRVLPKLMMEGGGPKTNVLRDVVVAVIRNTSTLFLLVLALNASAASLPFRNALHEWLRVLLIAGLWWQIGLWATTALGRMFERIRSRRALEDPSSVSAYGIMSLLGRVATWALIAVIVLYEFDYPITGLLAGLGVGGIAVAFALQNILADVFNSVAILLDKPFRVGDFVIIGQTMGTIEQIGIKTTRIRSLSGEQIVVSNTDLLGSRIHNYKRMVERRVLFQIGVVYQTPVEKVEMIPGMIREIIEDTSKTRFDRGHFKAFGPYSLDYEFVYYVLGADYALYMDIQQEINLTICRKFEELGIIFAYPTQELHLRHLNVAATLEQAKPADAPEHAPEAEA